MGFYQCSAKDYECIGTYQNYDYGRFYCYGQCGNEFCEDHQEDYMKRDEENDPFCYDCEPELFDEPKQHQDRTEFWSALGQMGSDSE